jgi:hypothetical protein
MTVAELIEHLKTLDQEAKVRICVDVGEYYPQYECEDLTEEYIDASSYKGYCYIGD